MAGWHGRRSLAVGLLALGSVVVFGGCDEQDFEWPPLKTTGETEVGRVGVTIPSVFVRGHEKDYGVAVEVYSGYETSVVLTTRVCDLKEAYYSPSTGTGDFELAWTDYYDPQQPWCWWSAWWEARADLGDFGHATKTSQGTPTPLRVSCSGMGCSPDVTDPIYVTVDATGETPGGVDVSASDDWRIEVNAS